MEHNVINLWFIFSVWYVFLSQLIRILNSYSTLSKLQNEFIYWLVNTISRNLGRVSWVLLDMFKYVCKKQKHLSSNAFSLLDGERIPGFSHQIYMKSCCVAVFSKTETLHLAQKYLKKGGKIAQTSFRNSLKLIH